MAAFLLSWNPRRFPWNDLLQHIGRVRTRGGATVRWSCGNRTDLPKRSEFYLVRLGPAPKGIVGRGITLAEPYLDDHWDDEKRRQKIQALYVKIRFTTLAVEPIVGWEELSRPPFARFKWSTMASGIRIPDGIADALDERFRKAGTAAPGTAGSADAWTDHPYAAELEPELEILNRAELSGTEKTALIAARRGQGLFRDNVARVEPRCRLTGVTERNCLRASHIKPWAVASDAERLSENNGLMLAPHVDHLFDSGLISFTDTGDLLVSPKCPVAVLDAWHIAPQANVGPFRAGQRPFLAYHRTHCFKR